MDSRGWDQRYGTTEYVWTDTVNQFVERHLALDTLILAVRS